MSESLQLPGIRAGAMNPPAGAARGYEDMLMGEFEQAAADERRLRREGMEAAMQRALDRSGIYNVGKFLIPQDLGELALGAAMGPGLGRGMRTALAALGGMTTQPSEAEGAFLPREMFRHLRGHPAAAARRESDRGMTALDDAIRASRRSDAWLATRGPDDLNAAFPDLLEAGAPYGVIPTEGGWRALLDPTRPSHLHPRMREISEDVLNFASEIPIPQSRVYFDPWYASAVQGGSDPLVRVQAGRPSGSGAYSHADDSITVSARTPFDEQRRVMDHELQHRVQRIDPNRSLIGGSPDWTARRNPDLWNEYLARHTAPSSGPEGWASVSGGPEQAQYSAARHMYENNFGEWEARLAEDVQRQVRNVGQMPQLQGFNPFSTGLVENIIRDSGMGAAPDFRIR